MNENHDAYKYVMHARMREPLRCMFHYLICFGVPSREKFEICYITDVIKLLFSSFTRRVLKLCFHIIFTRNVAFSKKSYIIVEF
jgi:hypothetical protein